MTDRNVVQDLVRIKENRQLVARFLIEFGIDGSDTLIDQLAVMLEAVMVMDNREVFYRDIWRNHGGVDNLRNAKRKVARQMRTLTVIEEGTTPLAAGHLDDAIDAINYLAFTVRNIREMNFDGVGDDEEE